MPCGAADQPGVRNAPAAIGIQQRHLGIAMAEPGGGLARMRRRDVLLDLTGAHAGLATLSTSALKKRSRKAVQTPAATVAAIGIGVDQHAALRIVGGDLPIGLAQILMKFEVFRLEPVGRAAAAPRRPRAACRSPTGTSRMRVRSGLRSPMVTRCIASSKAGVDLPEPALIGARRIGEPVAQHPGALRQRRLDHACAHDRRARPRTAASPLRGRAACPCRTAPDGG